MTDRTYPRPAVDLDAPLDVLFEAGADAGTVGTSDPDMIRISIDWATAEEIDAIWARAMGRLELHQRLAASLAQAKAGEHAPGSGADTIRDAFGEARRLHELIVTDPDIRGGMPTLKRSHLEALEIADQARLESLEEIYAEYPTLKPDLLAAAIGYAKHFEDDKFCSAFRRVRGTVSGDLNLGIGDGDVD